MNGILRVGGRIDKAELPWKAKHSIAPDHAHDIIRLIVIHYYRKLIHAGAWKFWVKSTKAAMKAIMGNVVTVDEVFLTVVTEVKFLLKSRPLVYGGSSTSATDVSDAK